MEERGHSSKQPEQGQRVREEMVCLEKRHGQSHIQMHISCCRCPTSTRESVGRGERLLGQTDSSVVNGSVQNYRHDQLKYSKRECTS